MAAHDDAGLVAALRTSAHQLTESPRPSLDDAIAQIVVSAVDTIAPAAGAGIARTGPGTVPSAYATSDDVRTLDQLQVRLHQGPCVTAADHPPDRGFVHARDLAGRDRDLWPSFAPQAVVLGYRSLLSLPLSHAAGHSSALNFYAREPHAFDEEAVVTASLFSLQAETLLYGVRSAESMRRALNTRDLIGQAKGVLIERFHLTDDDAFQLLVEASQSTNRKLVDVARWLLSEAQQTGGQPSSALRCNGGQLDFARLGRGSGVDRFPGSPRNVPVPDP